MSQKFIKKVNTNPRSMAYGKCFARAIYDKNFVDTKTLADFIQTQASVKRSDVIAVLHEALLRDGTEGEIGGHRYLQGRILVYWY